MGLCASKPPVVTDVPSVQSVPRHTKISNVQSELIVDISPCKDSQEAIQDFSEDGGTVSDTVDDQFQSMIEIDFTRVIPQSSFLEYLGVSNAKELVSRILWVGLKEDKRDTCKFWEGQVFWVKGNTVRMFFDNEEPKEFSVTALEKMWVELLLFRSEADLKRARTGAPVRRLRRSLKGRVPVRKTILAETFSGSADEQGSQQVSTPDSTSAERSQSTPTKYQGGQHAHSPDSTTAAERYHSTPTKYHSMTVVQQPSP